MSGSGLCSVGARAGSQRHLAHADRGGFTRTRTPANGWNRDGVARGLSDREDFVNAWELFAIRVELFLGCGFDVFVAPVDGHAVVIART